MCSFFIFFAHITIITESQCNQLPKDWEILNNYYCVSLSRFHDIKVILHILFTCLDVC